MSEEKKEATKEPKLVKVKFTAHCTPYIKGDVAGLTEEEYKFYSKKGACEKVK